MKTFLKKSTLLLLSIVVLLLIAQLACSKITAKKPISDMSKFLSHITLTVPDTETTISFNAINNATSNYTGGPAQFAEHGMVKILTNHIVPLGKKEYVTFLLVDHGGSGTFTYLARFVPNKTGYVMKGCYLLGDRVKITTLHVDHKNSIVIGYKTHGPNQAMYEFPKVAVMKKIDPRTLTNSHCGS